MRIINAMPGGGSSNVQQVMTCVIVVVIGDEGAREVTTTAAWSAQRSNGRGRWSPAFAEVGEAVGEELWSVPQFAGRHHWSKPYELAHNVCLRAYEQYRLSTVGRGGGAVWEWRGRRAQTSGDDVPQQATGRANRSRQSAMITMQSGSGRSWRGPGGADAAEPAQNGRRHPSPFRPNGAR